MSIWSARPRGRKERMYCFSGPGMPADAEGDVPLDEEAEQLLTNSRDRNGVCVFGNMLWEEEDQEKGEEG